MSHDTNTTEYGSECTHKHPMEFDEEPLVALHCLSHTYPDGTRSVHDVSFAVFEDETVGLIGANGAGKSTLMEHLNGLLEVQAGELRVAGELITDENVELARQEVGFVFQDADAQIVAPTVLDDVMFGPLNYGASRDEARERAHEALERLDAEHLVDRVPHHLSGGEKRLVAIAGVLAMDPSVIVMDEPLAGLDPARERRVREVIEELQADGISLVVATHDVDFAAAVADRLVAMTDGDIVGDGPPDDLFYDDALLQRANLEPPTAVRMARELDVEEADPVTEDELVAALSRRQAVPSP
ncbi:Energy-coupling factor transporter ATP-binding protein EcfA2 [Halapricum desulfuricans]|uniref:Energy-coupling factor transporter ATP-binding protein EcfA2 n=2 Tax=Halapricum desulfuricans TaxID=2841257 RepID=A0A897NCG1_9EURY|nr:ABC transporter ATP-binding protein [Halapricum desulfuricans]QSG12100.1 Energy-coupling factor transporter ATP-binding protein EcfA2 [Halapricum desulfuricans]